MIAAAGARKTTHLAEKALECEGQRVLMTTYTRFAAAQIENMLVAKVGCVPPRVSVSTWYIFLLREGIRPYQRAITGGRRVGSIDFRGDPAPYARKAEKGPYYFNSRGDVYRDRVAECVIAADDATNGAVIRRLAAVYDHIMVDEMQDLSGYDLNVLDRLFDSRIAVTCVGDPRQATFATNHGGKNRKFKFHRIVNWLADREEQQKIEIGVWDECHRSIQAICDLADALYPDMPPTRSKQPEPPHHHGVFQLHRSDVKRYVADVKPTVLCYDVNSDTEGLAAINFGASKGQTFDHVLIFPTKGFCKYLASGDLSEVGSVAKHYVAITRAKYSVAIVID